MDIKVSLDLEIAAYRKLLESEEARLKITPAAGEREVSRSSSSRSSAQRLTPSRSGAKRKRTLMEESHESSVSDYSVTGSTKGDVEIIEADPDGKFVKLHNKSNQDVPIGELETYLPCCHFILNCTLISGGWQVIRRAGNDETHYKFNRSSKIEAKGTVTVWSSDLNKDHEPPHDLVMKSQRWVVGDNMTTALLNLDGEEVAISER